MPTTLILIRHGETDWNAQGRIQGHTDIALNERGLAQAERVAHALGKMHATRPISAVISSDLQRAVQTAKPIAAQCSLQVSTDARLREKHYGILEGMTWEERNAKHPELDYAHELANPLFTVPHGESRAAFYERIVANLKQHAKSHVDKTIVIVAHGGVLDMAYRAACNIELTKNREWETPNCVLNAITCHQDEFKLLYWADDFTEYY